ncbi:Glutathione-S-transferase S-4-like [Frankliniella occidentalis]|uniref:glutathione transferase n=1 Tax=Frankliniella occidentalis TaxID=133901 RepID=A0A6J1SUA2_FRAOC|nr:glutathione S-transferase [Frankliniella occidentalis]KAE8747441.1 Glutathione-S-transferase S-4-like [Frankliniella occidentalis]
MPSYKLTYFPIRGRAEHLRVMFAYAKVQYEDNRISQDEWKTIKPTTPFGQLPVLEIDGVPVEQSISLARYLAKQFNIDGKDDMERLQADVFVSHIEDSRAGFVGVLKEQDPEKKAKLLETQKTEVLPAFFEKLDKRVAKNGGFSAGKSLLWSDIMLATYLEALVIKDIIGADFDAKYPNLAKVKDAVFNNPSVKAYIDKRPHTDI